jgi:hypothetical protein
LFVQISKRSTIKFQKLNKCKINQYNIHLK